MFGDRSTGFIRKNRSVIIYFCISAIVTILDISIVWILRNIFTIGIISANTIGVVSGSILQYFLVSKYVFFVKYGIPGLLTFIGTFFLGLLLADWIIWFSSESLPHNLNKNLNLLISKGFSIAIPFFVLYGIRKLLFNLIKKRGGDKCEKNISDSTLL